MNGAINRHLIFSHKYGIAPDDLRDRGSPLMLSAYPVYHPENADQVNKINPRHAFIRKIDTQINHDPLIIIMIEITFMPTHQKRLADKRISEDLFIFRPVVFQRHGQSFKGMMDAGIITGLAS